MSKRDGITSAQRLKWAQEKKCPNCGAATDYQIGLESAITGWGSQQLLRCNSCHVEYRTFYPAVDQVYIYRTKIDVYKISKGKKVKK